MKSLRKLKTSWNQMKVKIELTRTLVEDLRKIIRRKPIAMNA